MAELNRRGFLVSSGAAAGVFLANIGVLASLSRGFAADTRIEPRLVYASNTVGRLIRLIHSTPREKCISVFVEEIRRGLSYQDFLTTLFLAALENGDPHQVAQVYAAHRVSSMARAEERLLPMFWALDRVRSEYEARGGVGAFPELKGELTAAGRAADIFRDAMAKSDPEQAERAIVALARRYGPRHAMSRLWKYGARRAAGTLGHHPIVLANSWRTLEAMGWQHAEPVLRYAARMLPLYESDRAYRPNVERVERALAKLPSDWSGGNADRQVTIELFEMIRQGQADDACDEIVGLLSTGRAQIGSVWDAIHLAAADLVFRYKTGGSPIGAVLIYAVTSTNSLRFGFDCCAEDETRLLMLLQGVGALGDIFVEPAQKEGQVRDIGLLDLKIDEKKGDIGDVFSMLPFKTRLYTQKSADERAASDEACRMAFALLQDRSNHEPFQRTALGLLCAKASLDPHDFKYPIASFEDTSLVSAEWRPHLLASSVHALHGTNSEDSIALAKARDALG